MVMFEELLAWSKATFLPLGPVGLFFVAFIESIFFPIPPDLLLIPLVLLEPTAALWLAAICTAGSVSGAVLGWWIGLRGGRPILHRFVSDHRIEKVEGYYRKYGALAVGIAAFTPIPYKIFTIASGVLRFSLPKLIAVSVVGRGARFFSEAAVLMLWGPQILGFLTDYFELVTLATVAAIVIGWLAWRHLRKHRAPR